MEIHPIELCGPWTKGYEIDKHMIRSKYIGEDVYGHRMFDNTRSPIGEMVYQLKYRMNLTMIDNIMELIIPFLELDAVAVSRYCCTYSSIKNI